MAKKYTLDELLIITAAREIRDGENVILGVGLPTTAGAMAKALHAPHATLMMESGILDIEPLVPPNHIADTHSCRGFSATDLFSMFTSIPGLRGRVLGWQVDRSATLTTVIDDYKPKMRLRIGQGGGFLSYAKKTISLRGEVRQQARLFTSPATGGRDIGTPQGSLQVGGHALTTKGVFRFDRQPRNWCWPSYPASAWTTSAGTPGSAIAPIWPRPTGPRRRDRLRGAPTRQSAGSSSY